MSNLNLNEASLLDASGELPPPARRHLMAHISRDFSARQTYHDTCENFALLSVLPIPEPSAAERKSIPAAIKKALHLALHQHENQATASLRWLHGLWMLFRCATTGLALVGLVALGLSFAQAHDQNGDLRIQAAQINARIDRVAALSGPQPTFATDESFAAYDDPDSLSALAVLSSEIYSRDTEDADYSAPAGSY